MRRWIKRLAIAAGSVVVFLLVAGAIGAIWLVNRLDASLPVLEGEVELSGLSAPVTIERDELGVPTIRGASRTDVARATGFLHGQDRFFQMDLLRRGAAGELSELLGPGLVDTDRRYRVHRFREVARRNLSFAETDNRALLQAYAEGVNAGLAALREVPPEYLLLRTDPRPWLPEDTNLVVLAMYIDLQGGFGRRESDLGLMYDLLPRGLFEFLTAAGTEWDAPIVGPAFATPPIPPPEEIDLRREAPVETAAAGIPGKVSSDHLPGSNNWAVAGSRTTDGGALVANDMHLGHSMPNIWYRASFVWPDESGGEHRITGVTLPGSPPMIVGSNGRVAWGFTNSQGDFSDLVVLETDPGDADLYMTPDGPREVEKFDERILIKGGEAESLEVSWTIWGPILGQDHQGRRRALRWAAHDLEGVNLNLLRMERARDLDEALDIASATGIPTQNCVVADSSGRIGWTLMGPFPQRSGFDGLRPVSWANGDAEWTGYYSPADHPRVVDPAEGQIWTANNRVVDGTALDHLGDGGYALGARARQIRDGLRALDVVSVADLLAIQLDDRALFLERWRELLLDTLDSEALEADPRRRELKRFVEETWTGHASVDSVGYRMVNAFRWYLADQVLGTLTAPCREANPKFSFRRVRQYEGPLWRLVTERPLHLLDPRFDSWRDQLLSAVDTLLDRFLDEDHPTLDTRTWGARNTVRVQHPISRGVPQLARWLDIPPEQLPGDSYMPRVQSTGFGASMRMVVSPGREEGGLFHMPAGQSGHFRSRYYSLGHEAWTRGEATPFLPGPPVHELTLAPPG